MKFPCLGCGLCCKNVGLVAVIVNAQEDENIKFPYNWDDSGQCEMLQEDNTCKVYEDRPLICNVEKFANYYGIDKGKYYAENIEACEKLMDKYDFPKEKRIWKKD